MTSPDVCAMEAKMRVADTAHASQRTANIAHPSQQRRKNPGARCPRLAESNLGELPLRILSGWCIFYAKTFFDETPPFFNETPPFFDPLNFAPKSAPITTARTIKKTEGCSNLYNNPCSKICTKILGVRSNPDNKKTTTFRGTAGTPAPTPQQPKLHAEERKPGIGAGGGGAPA